MKLGKNLKGIFQEVGETLKDVAGAAGDVVSTVVGGVSDGVKRGVDLLGLAADTASSLTGTAIEGAGDVGESLISDVVGQLLGEEVAVEADFDATPWLVGGAVVLVIVAVGAYLATRRK